MGKFDYLERDARTRLLRRRAAGRQPGLVLERRELDDCPMLRRHADRLHGNGLFSLERLRWT